MACTISRGIKWTADRLFSLLPSATPASSSSTPSEAPNTALEDLKRLQRTMWRIQSILMDARQRGVGDHSEKHRLEELKDVAYDAEDVVDDYEYDVRHAKMQAWNRMHSLEHTCSGQKRKRQEEVIDLDSISVNVPVSGEIAGRVKKIRESFEEIIGEWDALRWGENECPTRHDFNIMRRPPTSSLVQEKLVHGRGEDVENVIKLLFSGEGSGKEGTLRVLPIVGMGGIGKTTLAQLVYARVCEQFELHGWVCVSEENSEAKFNVVALTRNIITSFTNKNCELDELSRLHDALEEEVRGKRFFLVLDDVWNEIEILWDLLRLPLTFSRSGTIIVTTRSSVVAKIMQTEPSYTLHDLKFEDCWLLFQQLVFGYQKKAVDEAMVEIARKIVAKCSGLPLAVKIIGSVCRTEYDVENWIDILESKAWDKTHCGVLLPVLKLSYDHMPGHLQECFALFALFTKGHVFFEDRIIHLWMSLGYIHSDNVRSPEGNGRMYINELQERSMIQRTEDPQAFVLHDLLHDLARQVAGNEVLGIEPEIKIDWHRTRKEISFPFNKPRYLSILSPPEKRTLFLKDFQGSRTLRLVQVLAANGNNIVIHPDMFLNLRHIRALDFSQVSLTTLSESIGNLKQLRYLNLSNTGLMFLPDSICSLHNMQTLELTGCPLSELPKGIGDLTNLRHLKFSSKYLSCLPYGIRLLTNLQTLGAFIVVNDNTKCNIGGLRDLAYLTGTLPIMRLANVTNIEDVKEANLRKKQFLQELILNWTSGCGVGAQYREVLMREFDDQVLESLEPNPNLVKLTIKMYGGLKFPGWVGGISFNKLVEVSLLFFLCEFLPPLGQLPSLKFLICKGGNNVCQVGREFFGGPVTVKGFQSLETLDFYGMAKWERWSGVKNGDFAKLRSFLICNCPELMALPFLLSSTLTSMKIVYCEQLTRIPNLPSLRYLYLAGNFQEKLLVHSHLPQLKIIEVCSMDNVQHLEVSNHSFPLLEELTFRGCSKLESLVGLTSLTSLKLLSIRKCPQLYISPEDPSHTDQLLGCSTRSHEPSEY